MTHPNQWPLVPGTRKRRGAKNLLEKLMNIGTWNVRTLNNEGNPEILLKHMKQLNIKILGVSETHWSSTEEDIFEMEGYVIINSTRQVGLRRQGVAFIIEKELSNNITEYAQYS